VQRGWTYEFKNVHNDWVAHSVAAWALLEDGSVVGLVIDPWGSSKGKEAPNLIVAALGKEGRYRGPAANVL
jgi:hypothetical protein